MSEQKLDLILEKLSALEAKVDALPTYEGLATTASRDDLNEVKDTLDYIATQFEENERQQALTEIRQSTRRAS